MNVVSGILSCLPVKSLLYFALQKKSLFSISRVCQYSLKKLDSTNFNNPAIIDHLLKLFSGDDHKDI
ncbi:hypothetical protein QQP08_022849 [Theobroma cacao]|nr:hypothetical protein QQP08_022849 [Theobroma cacao]